MNVIKHIQTQIQQPSVAIGTAALLILTSSMFAWRRRRSAAAAAAARSSKYPPETVVVYRYSHPEKKSNPDISPFIAKLEAYLKFSSTPHVLATGTLENAPKGKLPYIEHNGRLIGDSSLAIEYLVACGAAPDLDAGIGDEKKAVARAMKIMVEEHLYFALVWERWTVDENFKIYSDVVFGGLPFLQKLFVPSMVKKPRPAQPFGDRRHHEGPHRRPRYVPRRQSVANGYGGAYARRCHPIRVSGERADDEEKQPGTQQGYLLPCKPRAVRSAGCGEVLPRLHFL
ncbi:hypothetical protein BC936DRAFT_145683 [Jimgerdemannia flammicorona]|uniref:Thioredoxin-like fold domain-containing protein n=1 Tax=Jimgerdemannia flammicorona TaxID=994334 RepID=A0A433D9H3_9FUNG|nr:hypothetical protein BC936DRAFT_145683 [Jimgerdemannia flammicorona]